MENFTLKDAIADPMFFEYVKAKANQIKLTDSVTRGLFRDGVFKDGYTFKKHFTEVIEKRSDLSASQRILVRYIGMQAANKVYQRLTEQNAKR